MRVGAVSLKSGEVKLIGRGLNPRYTTSGYLVAAQAGGAVVAQRLDLSSLEASGPLRYIAESVYTSPAGWADFDISRNGTLAYMRGFNIPAIDRVDRMGTGRPLPVQVEGVNHYDNPRFSPWRWRRMRRAWR